MTETKIGNGSYGDVFEVTSQDSQDPTATYVVKKFKAHDIYNREMSLE